MRSPIFKIDKGNSARSEIDKTNFKIQFTLGCCEDNIFDFLIQLSVTIRRGFGPETYNEFCWNTLNLIDIQFGKLGCSVIDYGDDEMNWNENYYDLSIKSRINLILMNFVETNWHSVSPTCWCCKKIFIFVQKKNYVRQIHRVGFRMVWECWTSNEFCGNKLWLIDIQFLQLGCSGSLLSNLGRATLRSNRWQLQL